MATFLKRFGIPLEHCFAATSQFKGIWDGAGKDAKEFLRREEVARSGRFLDALQCYHACVKGMPGPTKTKRGLRNQKQMEIDWFNRRDYQFDEYFWRCVFEGGSINLFHMVRCTSARVGCRGVAMVATGGG